jgi:uncharacterized protein (DUF302 family)
MKDTRYGLQVTIPAAYDAAVQRATDALKAEGFGILTTIDVQQTLRAKLNREFRKYVILGACNPPLADRALQVDLGIGLLLPCNVVVYQADDGSSVIEAVAPLSAIGLAGDDPELRAVAQEADRKLRRVLSTIESQP